MAYTGGNAGYARRLGKIPSSGGGTPTSPADGYAAWFDAAVDMYADTGATVPATDGSNVRAWKSRGGSYGALTLVKDAEAAGDYQYIASSVNGQPSFSNLAPFSSLYSDTNVLGALCPTTGNTIMGVIFNPSARPFAVYSPALNTFALAHDQTGPDRLRFYVNTTGGYVIVTHPASYGAWHIVTWLLTDEGLYVGADDTRTASMTRGALPGTPTGYSGSRLSLQDRASAITGSKMAEIVFYPTALSEANRQTTEQYLANKYGITLPY